MNHDSEYGIIFQDGIIYFMGQEIGSVDPSKVDAAKFSHLFTRHKWSLGFEIPDLLDRPLFRNEYTRRRKERIAQ